MLGLDIGTYALKVVELQRKGDSFVLVNFKVQERPREEPLSSSLKKFLETAEVNPVIAGKEGVNISVSGHLVLARTVELPDMNEAELKNAIRFEVEKFLPFNIEDAILDYQVISKQAGTKRLTVLLAAAKKELVKGYIDAVLRAGFAVKRVDIDAIALINAFTNAYPDKGEEDKAFAILNVGESVLNVGIIYKGIPYVLRDISGTGKDISEAIAKGFGIDKKEAYQLKHNPSSDKQEVMIDLIKPTLSRLTREIRLSIGYFENQFSKGIETIYLSGGSSKLIGLKEILSESLEVQVESWDPFNSIKLDEQSAFKSLEDVKEWLPVAVGLAIRDDD